MRIVRIPAPGGFTQVPNAALRDERLSYKARGILASLLSNTDVDWNETAESLADKSPDGRDACRSGLRELAQHGYIEYRKTRDERGLWVTNMIVYSTPNGVSAGQSRDGKPAPGATWENTANPQVSPGAENPSPDEANGERKTRFWTDLGEQPVSAGRSRDGFSGVGKPGPIQKTTTEEPAGIASQPARAAAQIPDWAMPLVRRIQPALPGLRWNCSPADWILIDALLKAKGIDAMADHAERAAESATRPVVSARYFLNGWKELPAAAPDGSSPPALRAIPTSRRQQETDAMFDRAMQRATAREEGRL